MSAINHEYTNEVVCPHCGHEHSDSYEYFYDYHDERSMACDECEKTFIASRHITIDYSTAKPKCEEEHVYDDSRDSYWIQKQETEWVKHKPIYHDISEESWKYFVIKTCKVCDAQEFVELPKDEYTTRYEAWKAEAIAKVIRKHKEGNSQVN